MKYTVADPGVLLEFLVRASGASSRSHVRDWLKNGSVRVDGTVRKRADTALLTGQTVEVMPLAKTAAELARPATSQRGGRPLTAARRPAAGAGDLALGRFPVLYEDAHLIVLEKPAGLLSIGTDREKTTTFYKMVSAYVKQQSGGREFIFIVHRLDREVSGVMLFAKSEAVKQDLQANWADTEKIYLALVEGLPAADEGTVETWLRENTAHVSYVCRPGTEGAQWAVTHYRVLKTYPNRTSLLEVRIETGRKHQIRVHLASLGCPIVGDKKYGATTRPFQRLGLHAASLAFTHPVTQARLELVAAPPREFGR